MKVYKKALVHRQGLGAALEMEGCACTPGVQGCFSSGRCDGLIFRAKLGLRPFCTEGHFHLDQVTIC